MVFPPCWAVMVIDPPFFQGECGTAKLGNGCITTDKAD